MSFRERPMQTLPISLGPSFVGVPEVFRNTRLAGTPACALLCEAPELFLPAFSFRGARVDECQKAHKPLKRGFIDRVFHLTGDGLPPLTVNGQNVLHEISNDAMTQVKLFRSFLSFRRERHGFIRSIIHKPFGGEALQRRRHGGLGNTQSGRNIFDPREMFLPLKSQDNAQVILQCRTQFFRHSHTPPPATGPVCLSRKKAPDIDLALCSATPTLF